jgi:phenylpropionate dioxygenase-like ring-hydroxylating dioxygenase large terminal subunit
MTGLRRYWYVVAGSRELAANGVLARQVLDERLAIFRDATGRPVALQDRCLHRAGRLSAGRMRDGRLVCPYHGWAYGGDGRVVEIPSEIRRQSILCAERYDVCERDGYVYVRLVPGEGEPFAMPYWGQPGWASVRLKNRFNAALADCIENFIDIPHTVVVHPGIFRDPRGERIVAHVVRDGSSVLVTYAGETNNLGNFSWLLNSGGAPIEHTDTFHAPNITCVRYALGTRWGFCITSQSVPVSAIETLVYTDLTFRFGAVTRLAKPIVRRQAQRVIDQDIAVLAQQAETIARYGRRFVNSQGDQIHVLVDSILREIAEGRDPDALPAVTRDVEFVA